MLWAAPNWVAWPEGAAPSLVPAAVPGLAPLLYPLSSRYIPSAIPS